jgi:hypothetical protein
MGEEMAYIRVIYSNKNSNFDYIPSHLLDLQIKRDEITHFYRPSEKRWVNVRLDPTRGRGGYYKGLERREAGAATKSTDYKPEESKRRATEWLEHLWADIEVSL